MKAAVFRGKGDIKLEHVEKPEIIEPKDALVRIQLTSVCGIDLHMYHGKIPFEKKHILGHEFVGVVEDIGYEVKNIKVGDKVVGTSSIACGECFYCKMSLYSQCDNANPNGKTSAFFGSPKKAGGFQGSQAEYLRVPFADIVLYKIPEGITDEQALIMSDILPAGYFGADMAQIKPGESVAIFGAGSVGQMAAISAKYMGAEKIYIIDHIESRLQMAEEYGGAIPINFSKVNPHHEIMKLTNKNGVDKVIEAVGLEADSSTWEEISKALKMEVSSGQTIRWAIESVRKGGVISVIGTFQGDIDNFPIGDLQGKNITLIGGSCPHRKYLDTLTELIKSKKLSPDFIITHRFKIDDIEKAYHLFDKEKDKCLKELISV